MKNILSALILMSLIFITGNTAKAAGPQIFITWSSDGYAPPGYIGKILPTNGSRIKARVSALSINNFQDLSKEEIAWYINGVVIQDGIGMQSADFDISTLTQSSLEIKVQLLSMQGGPYSKTVEIPIVQPEAVIEHRSPDNTIKGDSISLTALPFFFRVQDISELNFSWEVNGDSPSSLTDPQYLNIKSSSGFRSGSEIRVSLITSKGNQSASQVKTFVAQ